MTTERRKIVIIGSGFGGIGMAIALRRAGFADFVLLEKASDLGGTWRDNQYPGCACDVLSPLYSFSFDLNPSWIRLFAPQPTRSRATSSGAAKIRHANRHARNIRFHGPGISGISGLLDPGGTCAARGEPESGDGRPRLLL